MSITATGHNQVGEGARALFWRDITVMHDYLLSGQDAKMWCDQQQVMARFSSKITVTGGTYSSMPTFPSKSRIKDGNEKDQDPVTRHMKNP